MSCCKSLKNLAAAWLILGFELFWIRFFSLHACLFGIWNSSSLFFSDKTGFGGRISFGSVLIESSKIYYIKMKVCVCVCVSMCVRRTAAGTTQAITPKFGMGSSFHPGSAPSQGATQNVDPRGTRYSDPVWKNPEGLRIGQGAANKICSSGWVCIAKFYLRGAHPNLGPAGSTLPMGGVCFENWAGPANKSYSSGWVWI
jgi:hypothetical protein